MRRSITVIINPIAGVRPKDEIPGVVHEMLPPDQFDVDIRFTEYAGHASEIATEAVARGADSVVAIGGDGTINETAKSLIGSNTALGIVPMGSGNGLARHIQIPLEMKRALQVVRDGHRDVIDYGDVNGHIFFCTAGIGFDAMVSHEFSEKKGRGPINYARSAIEVFAKYNPLTYSIYTDDGKVNERAFLIAIGNAAQWGNNAYIAPRASMTDGLLDITIVKPFQLIEAPQMAMQLFSGHLDENPNVITFRSESIRIVAPQTHCIVHVDGEPFELNGVLIINVHKAGLYVLTPEGPMNNLLEPIQYAIEDIHFSIWNNIRNGVRQLEKVTSDAIEEIGKAVEPVEQLKKRAAGSKSQKKK